MGNPKILITDDMPSMRTMLKSILIHAGFLNLVEADNGHAAIDLLRESRFDLVICDWDMPRMSGIQVLETIRADDKLQKMPFIMVTANADRDKVTQAINAGTDGYIIKPLQPETLTGLVNKLLGAGESVRAST
ncbi:MAG: response regulator [Gammaproteobacteria bacterium]|nr:response regulator [Gammaproteobacteria bacterium]MDH5650467.1 response regulator [Gammaproteobacteria bacterium]